MPETRSVADLFAESLNAQRAEDFDRAQVLLRQVLALEPGHADALNNLGLIAYRAHCYPEAIGLIGKALARIPERPAFHNNLGVVLSVSGRRREAVEAFTRAVAGAPGNASFRGNLANALKECGEFPRALEEFRAALSLEARHGEAHLGAAICLLALGRVGEAWPEYRWRVAAGGLQVPAAGGALYQGIQERADGEFPASFRGKRVLVLHEQGLGDQLFFLRFAPVLKSAGARLACFAPEKLAPLLARCGAFEQVFTDPGQAPPTDHLLLLGDLPLAGTAASGKVPPPLRVGTDAAALAGIKQRLARAGPAPYLGITWRAGNAPATGRPEALRKAVPVPALAQAVAGWKGTILALQRHPGAGEIDAFSRACGLPVHDCSDLNEDIDAMHALLAVIEEYAGVSNTNMHLRAAAGATARVLVAFPPEWRWLATGDESPWYPGFRLYREEEGAGWQPALARLREDLGQSAQPKRSVPRTPRAPARKSPARRG